MKKNILSLAVALITCAYSVPGSPMAAVHGKQKVSHPEWPAGLNELVNHHLRVHGYWVNANDFFFYSGGTEAFNKFLAQRANLSGTPLTLVLHPSTGATPVFGGERGGIDFAWGLKILARGWHPQAPMDHNTCKRGYVAVVELWRGGSVD